MTITLATVYTPVALQGGLTGSLFREFAFTLAGAVLISGFVALTLSPMMGSKLLRAGDTERGFAGMDQPRASTACASATRACSAGTLNYRPVVLTLWVIVVALIFPFYMFSQKELAPPEDQSFIFGIIQAAANSTIEQTKLFANADRQGLPLVPGDGGDVRDHLADRRLRRHGRQAVQPAQTQHGRARRRSVSRRCRRSPASAPSSSCRRRCRAIRDSRSTWPSSPPRSRRSSRNSPNQLVQKAFASGKFMFADTDLKFDQPQARVVFDRDKLRAQGVDHDAGRPRSLRRSSAATTSTASASRAAATKSSRRSSAASG